MPEERYAGRDDAPNQIRLPKGSDAIEYQGFYQEGRAYASFIGTGHRPSVDGCNTAEHTTETKRGGGLLRRDE